VIRTRGTFTDDQLNEVVGLLRDPESPLEVEPVTLEVTAASGRSPRDALGDPWDRFITATAMALELPLVRRDRRIIELRLVETICYRRSLVWASAPRQDRFRWVFDGLTRATIITTASSQGHAGQRGETCEGVRHVKSQLMVDQFVSGDA
jgi:hypothetical protein